MSFRMRSAMSSLSCSVMSPYAVISVFPRFHHVVDARRDHHILIAVIAAAPFIDRISIVALAPSTDLDSNRPATDAAFHAGVLLFADLLVDLLVELLSRH